MNLWARTAGQLTVLAVALFFFSCEDETSILGFKKPSKFRVNYVDIPLGSDVLLLDSLRTSNFSSTGETNRLLVGRYTDDQFGEVSSTAITQFFTTNGSRTLLKEGAQFDSVSIELRFDFYNYGSRAPSIQTISVHEVEKELIIDSLNYYFNKSHTPYNPTPLGTKSFAIAPATFDELIEENASDTVTINFPLNYDFGKRIFDSAVRNRDAVTSLDTTFANVRPFVKEFKGIAIVPQTADKLFGINPMTTETRIILHYHDATTDSLRLNLSFIGLINYNEIIANRGSTELAGLTQYSQPFDPGNMRYVQSGTGVTTRLDFLKFYEFVDADSNALMIVNSAELFLGTPEASSVLAPINTLSIRALKGEGFLKRVVDPNINKAQHLADSASVTQYAGQLGVVGDFLARQGVSRGMFTPLGADGNVFTISRTGDNPYYSGFFTKFAQEVFRKDPSKERFRYFALYPEDPQIGKSVNRLIFNKDNIKLRVYYSRPQPLE
jgi:hypothetical protein